MKWLAVLLGLLLVSFAVRAEGPDDQYVQIYNLIQEADKLNNNRLGSEALPKYLEAQNALRTFQKGYADWNANVVKFRLNYVAEQIAALTPKTTPPSGTAAASTTPAPGKPAGPGSTQAIAPAPAADWQNQLNALKDQVQQLQADKSLLEAKLKEALAAQPAAMDPRELAKAEERIRNLTKENDLLKATLDQQKNKPAALLDNKALDEALRTLADANGKLAEQTTANKRLLLDKSALQAKLEKALVTPAATAELESTRKALAEANRKLAEQARLTAELTAEKETLQQRIKTLSTDADTAALRMENQLLKQQLADLKAAPAPTTKADQVNQALAQARAQIASLQSDKEMLRLEKVALETRVKTLSADTKTQAAPSASSRAADAAKIKQLEKERDELKKSLAAANKELYSRKGKAAAARLVELENELTALRTRLLVYEAKQIPYTAEELALFDKPQPKPAAPAPKASMASVKELPAGTVELVAEAQRSYANRDFDSAAQKYSQVLQKDKNNVPTLANLASIELDRGHLDAAEMNIKQAVALAPKDAYSQFVLGRLRLTQKKYDEAVDALSLAAQLDPRDAQIQNFLGLALSAKGMRGPAETALRKAIQIEPGYASAHNNLAVVYMSQQPPLMELARWHYQKALAAGQPRNPDLERMLEAKSGSAAKQ